MTNQDLHNAQSVQDAVLTEHTLQLPKKKHQRIGVKLLSYLLGFSFFVTLATFSYILLTDYHRGISQYEKSVSQIQASHQQSISYSLWNFDTQQIESQLEGILNFPGVVYVYIETQNTMIHSAGDVLTHTDQRHSFPLRYVSNGKRYQLGELHIDMNYSQLYSEIREKALQILFTQFFKTFSISIFVLFIVRLLITRRLAAMSEWARRFSLDNLDDALQTNIDTDDYDELDQVSNAINKMRLSLKAEVEEQQKNKEQLLETKEQLSIAIDNAELGFCRYNPTTDRISCNIHLANLLGSTLRELESMPHPMEQLRDRIIGDDGEEIREKFNQLLFGRINKLQGCFKLKNFADKEKYADIAIQILSYEENRSGELLVCMVDKTKEQKASHQAQELTINLENKVSKRTEELYEEQQRAKINIEKLTLQLDKEKHNQRYRLDTKLNFLLLKQLQADHQPSLELIRDYLDLALNGTAETIDLSAVIKQWLDLQPQLKNIQRDCVFPLSLILDENKQLIYFLLECLIIKEPALKNTSSLSLKLNLHGEVARLELLFSLDQVANTDAINQIPQHLELCDYIICSQLDGDFDRYLNDQQQLITSFSFSLNHQKQS